MEKYEKPCMEIVEIEEELNTAPPSCGSDGGVVLCPFDGTCGVDISHS